MIWKSFLLSILPGLGQIHSGRAGRGLAWFSLFVFLFNAYFMAPFLLAGRGLRIGALVAFVTCWVLAFFDALWCTVKLRPVPLPELSHERHGP